MELRLQLLEQQLAALEGRFQNDLAQTREAYEDQLTDLRVVIMRQAELHREAVERLETRLHAQEQEREKHQQRDHSARVIGEESSVGKPSRLPRASSEATLGRSSVEVSRHEGEVSIGLTPRRKPRKASLGPAKESPSMVNGASTMPHDIAAVLEQHRSRINGIYDFYATSSHETLLFHPALTFGQFTKLVNDCRLPGPSRPSCTPELLWMGVIRALHARQPETAALQGSPRSSASPQKPNPSVLMVRGRYQATEKNKGHFAFLRVEKIQRRHFAEMLYLLWCEWRVAKGGGAPSTRRRDTFQSFATPRSRTHSDGEDEDGERFALFLQQRILPGTARAMERQRRRDASHLSSSYAALQTSISSAANGGPNTTIDISTTSGLQSNVDASALAVGFTSTDGGWIDYGTVVQAYAAAPGVKSVVKEYGSHIKQSFHTGVHGVGRPGMDLDDFVALVRRHNLLPLIQKAEVKRIFEITCLAGTRALSLTGYLSALYCLAEVIYAAPAVAARYPSPESRLQKLLTKMFILEQ